LDKSSITESLNQLEHKLREAASQRKIHNRAASKSALEAILVFLYKAKPQWAVEQLHRPLVDLLTSLIDLDSGRVGPLLSPTVFDNRHPDAVLLQMRRGFTIFAIEQLVTVGEKVSPASEKVAKIWNERTGETRKSLTIKSWYDRRHKLKKSDAALDVLTNLRMLWNTENLDRSSAAAVNNMLRATGLDHDLNDHLPRTESEILDLLARVLAVIKPGP
jgi:hypothetical protein